MRFLGRRKYPRSAYDVTVPLWNLSHTYASLITYDPVSTCKLQFILRWPVVIEEHNDLPLALRKSAYPDLLKLYRLQLEHIIVLRSMLIRSDEIEKMDTRQMASQFVRLEKLKCSFEGYRREFRSAYLCELDPKLRQFVVVRTPITTRWRFPGGVSRQVPGKNL